MKRKIAFIMFLFMCMIFFGEDIYFHVAKDTEVFSTPNLGTPIKKGEKIKYLNRIDTDGKSFKLKVFYNNKEGWINIQDIKLENSDLFPNDITFQVDGNNNIWIPSYYFDILKKKDRKLILKYEPYMKDEENLLFEYNPFTPITFMISNFIIYGFGIGGAEVQWKGASFTIINIKKSPSEDYLLHTFFETASDGADNKNINLSSLRNKSLSTIILKVHPNKNKIRLYNEDGKTLICELIRISDVFSRQYIDFVLDDAVPSDMDIPTWVDDPWPDDISKSTTTSTPATTSFNYRTTVNLRVRSTSDLSSQVITTLPEGTKVKILETGRADTINDIKGNWVKVESETGTTGWCFNGYLSH